jgi:hypothetical protein
VDDYGQLDMLESIKFLNEGDFRAAVEKWRMPSH